MIGSEIEREDLGRDGLAMSFNDAADDLVAFHEFVSAVALGIGHPKGRRDRCFHHVGLERCGTRDADNSDSLCECRRSRRQRLYLGAGAAGW